MYMLILQTTYFEINLFVKYNRVKSYSDRIFRKKIFFPPKITAVISKLIRFYGYDGYIRDEKYSKINK